MDEGEEDFEEVGEGQVVMSFQDGAPNAGQHTILVATADMEPQVDEDVMLLGIVEQGVGLLNFVPKVKILVGMVVVCVVQVEPNQDWYFVID